MEKWSFPLVYGSFRVCSLAADFGRSPTDRRPVEALARA